MAKEIAELVEVCDARCSCIPGYEINVVDAKLFTFELNLFSDSVRNLKNFTLIATQVFCAVQRQAHTSMAKVPVARMISPPPAVLAKVVPLVSRTQCGGITWATLQAINHAYSLVHS